MTRFLRTQAKEWTSPKLTLADVAQRSRISEGCQSVTFSKFTNVKAPNFGPHGNFGPLFQKGLLSLKRVIQKNEENKSCRKNFDLQIRFCSLFVHDSSTEATELARKSPKFP
jgi:hypothetical protein